MNRAKLAYNALFFTCLLALPTMGAAQSWNGWARCVLEISGPGYSNNETHTWSITNITGSTPTLAGDGTWSVAGAGSHYLSDGVTSERAEWSIGGGASGGRYIFQVANGVRTIRPVHSQLRQSNAIVGYSQQSISGSPRTPTAISATAWEWTFPAVQGPAGSQTLSGTSVITPTAPWGIRQPYGSSMTARCEWSFADGAVPPPPPPPVNPPPPPVPPSQNPPPPPPPTTSPAAMRWSGWVECEITASAVPGYQETQLHRWEVPGSRPTAAGNAYQHAAVWQVKGNGSSRNRLETTRWTTQGSGKTPLSMAIRPSDGRLVIGPAQKPLVIAGGLQGTRQPNASGATATPISFDAWEWALPSIDADPKQRRFKGQVATPLGARLSRLQPSNASGTSSCRWQFDSSAP